MVLIPQKRLLDLILARARSNKRLLGPSLHILVRRALEGYVPHHDDDGKRIVVTTSAIGALPASAVNAGALAVLEQLGLNAVVDGWVGPSTGSVNNIFAMTNSVVSGMVVYPEIFRDKAFFNMMRYPAGPVIDLAYLVYELLENTFPLAWDAVVKSGVNDAGHFITVATNAKTGQPEPLRSFKNRASLQAAQIAAMFMPGVSQYGTKPTFKYGDMRLAEGAMSDPTGVLTAMAHLNPTHLVAFNGWPVQNTHQQYAFYDLLAIYAAIYSQGFKYNALAKSMSRATKVYKECIDEMTFESWKDKVPISLFAPDGSLPKFHYLDREPAHIWQCVLAGYESGLKNFGLTTEELPVPKLWLDKLQAAEDLK